ncbi:recombination protein RecT, partial [Salmonella enterica subsp. enterica serovar Anatum]|nr:recombination protein RecT [Salmonella enterica subsp. enterica serovar Anatum]
MNGLPLKLYHCPAGRRRMQMPKQPPIAKADLQKTQGARTPTAVKNNN